MKRLIILFAISLPAFGQVTDTFSGIGGAALNPTNWTTATVVGFTTPGQYSGTAHCTIAGTQCMAQYTGASFTPSQYAQVPVNGLTGGTGPQVLADNAGNSYECNQHYNGIYKLVNGSGASPGYRIAVAPAASSGDTFRLTAQVSAGVTHLTCTNITTGLATSGDDTSSPYTTGKPGFLVDLTGGSDSVGTFTAGNFIGFSAAPLQLVQSTTGNMVTLTGSGTSWTGTPFNVSGTACAITAQTVSSSTAAVLTMNAGASLGVCTITDSISGKVFPLNIVVQNTWYIRADGGGLYSAARVAAGYSGQAIGCDGLSDSSYPGSGTNQHCGLSDYRYLYDDQAGNPQTWIIIGGDTVIIEGCANGTNSPNYAPACRIGWDIQAGGFTWCKTTGACSNPPIPAGTALAHTRILGQNYLACGTSTLTDKTKLTEMSGGWSVGQTLYLGSTQYVDVACLNIWRHSNCTFFGSPASPASCNTSYPTEDDYDNDGIVTDGSTANVTLTDIWVHGHRGRGIKGNIGNGPVTCLRCNIDTNGGAGWDFDNGSGAPMGGANAKMVFNYSIIQWSGCNQEYPFVDPIPVASCFGQSNGGYGDAVGTPAGTGLSVSWDHSTSVYNVQDALDLGHVDTGGPYTLSVTDTFMAHNGGANAPKVDNKFGSNTVPWVIIGNVFLGDCARFSAPVTGAPAGYNVGMVGDMCRSGDMFPFNMDLNNQAIVANNTIISYFDTMFDIHCNASPDCTASSIKMYNNNVIGFANLGAPCGPCAPGYITYSGSSYGGTNIGPGLFAFAGTLGTFDTQNNIYYRTRQTCPTGFDNGICTNPMLQGFPTGNQGSFVEGEMDVFGLNTAAQSFWIPGIGSPAIGAGITYTQVPATDYFGVAMTSPPVIGGAVHTTVSSPTFLRGVVLKGVTIQ